MRREMTRFVTIFSFVLAALAMSIAPAQAQDAGIRGGISVDPDRSWIVSIFVLTWRLAWATT
jgi:hypothetical protein